MCLNSPVRVPDLFGSISPVLSVSLLPSLFLCLFPYRRYPKFSICFSLKAGDLGFNPSGSGGSWMRECHIWDRDSVCDKQQASRWVRVPLQFRYFRARLQLVAEFPPVNPGWYKFIYHMRKWRFVAWWSFLVRAWKSTKTNLSLECKAFWNNSYFHSVNNLRKISGRKRYKHLSLLMLRS